MPSFREATMFLLAFVSAYQFYNGYWKGRSCLTDTVTRCLAPDGTPVTNGGKYWIIPAVLFVIAGLQHAWKRNKQR